MDPERWQRVERIYNAAIEREPGSRDAFIEQECAGDEPLRREVESLLGCKPEATGVLEAPLRKVIAEKVAQDERAEILGRQLGNYRVLSPLGAGGMGEVYLAEDTRLDRKVAIKLLPPESTADEQAKRRLIREAKAAAKLDHPNICSIYEVAEAEGQTLIAMQYVEGETLAHRIEREPMEGR